MLCTVALQRAHLCITDSRAKYVALAILPRRGFTGGHSVCFMHWQQSDLKAIESGIVTKSTGATYTSHHRVRALFISAYNDDISCVKCSEQNLQHQLTTVVDLIFHEYTSTLRDPR